MRDLLGIFIVTMMVGVVMPLTLVYYSDSADADGGSYCFKDDGTAYHYSGDYCPEKAAPDPVRTPVTAPAHTRTPVAAPAPATDAPAATKPAKMPRKRITDAPAPPRVKHPPATNRYMSKNEAAMLHASVQSVPAFDGWGVGISGGGGTEGVALGVSRRQTEMVNLTGSVSKSGHKERVDLGIQFAFE